MGAMELDPQGIERRDFPIVRRGYDPASVDAHLRALAADVEELHREASSGDGSRSLRAPAHRCRESSRPPRPLPRRSSARPHRTPSVCEMRQRGCAPHPRGGGGARPGARGGRVEGHRVMLLGASARWTRRRRHWSRACVAGASRLAGDLAAVETEMGALYDAAAGRAAGEGTVSRSGHNGAHEAVATAPGLRRLRSRGRVASGLYAELQPEAQVSERAFDEEPLFAQELDGEPAPTSAKISTERDWWRSTWPSTGTRARRRGDIWPRTSMSPIASGCSTRYTRLSKGRRQGRPARGMRSMLSWCKSTESWLDVSVSESVVAEMRSQARRSLSERPEAEAAGSSCMTAGFGARSRQIAASGCVELERDRALMDCVDVVGVGEAVSSGPLRTAITIPSKTSSSGTLSTWATSPSDLPVAAADASCRPRAPDRRSGTWVVHVPSIQFLSEAQPVAGRKEYTNICSLFYNGCAHGLKQQDRRLRARASTT